MMGQTEAPDEFVLVCDGPLGPSLDRVISALSDEFSSSLRVVRLAKNVGLGPALNVGLAECRNELVARMDSDDVSLPDRCRAQLEAFAADPALDIVGGWIGEFDESPQDLSRMRKVPETDEAIREFAKVRCPFNHMTVMFRKSSVLDVGGYGDVPLCEDYDLWARMLSTGSRAANVQKLLVWARTDQGTLGRRRQPSVHRARMRIKKDLLKCGFMSKGEYVWSLLLDCAIAYAPLPVMEWVTRRMLRDDSSEGGIGNAG
jgi:glycosyltransferase involved in cell wall biosynthesis